MSIFDCFLLFNCCSTTVVSYRDNNLDRDYSPSTPPPETQHTYSIEGHRPPSPIYQQPTAADQPEYWLRNLDVNAEQGDIPVNPRNPYDDGSRPSFDASGDFTFSENALEIQEGGRYNPIYVSASAEYEADGEWIFFSLNFYFFYHTVVGIEHG